MRPSRKPRFLLIFLLVLCALFVYGYTARLEELSALQTEIADVQVRIEHELQNREKLEVEWAYVTSPEYVDDKARREFDMAKEGDRLVIPIQETGSAGASVTGGMAVQPGGVDEGEPAAAAFDSYDLPVWQQWVTFFAADSRMAR